MPRPSKGARLYREPVERDRQGKIIRRSTWVIRDGSRKVRTGIPGSDLERAEQALRQYLGSKHEICRKRDRAAAEILILDALNLYYQHVVEPTHTRPEETRQRIRTLAEFWGGRTLADIDGQTCRDYASSRVGQPWKSAKPERTGKAPRLVTAAAARRELEELRAAVNYQINEGFCREVVKIWLPEKSEPRDVCLTRSEAARIVWAAWRAKQVTRDNVIERQVGKHVARFILIGLYTGTRHAAICTAATVPAIGRGHVDLDRGIFHRLALGKKATKKRQTPVRLPGKLLDHMRRWQRVGACTSAVVEWNGKPIGSVRKGFAAAVRAAGLDPEKITPHVLRHTAATWMMQRGVEPSKAAEFLGMSEQVLRKHYYHHHPDFQIEAVEAIDARSRRRA